MKNVIAVAGTVIVSAATAPAKTVLNLQQHIIVTPRTAEMLGLSYDNLWAEFTVKYSLPHGSPIQVKITSDADPKVTPGSAPCAISTLEKITLAPEKNIFVRG